MTQITCMKCKAPIDSELDQCPHCSEKITLFQRTYASRLIDGKYQILDRLGVGGMGEIFKVRHIHLNELRVIKIMRPNVAADDQGMQRFLQEARTSTMIKQKNLAMLYDFAQLEDGSYYMVWEFIDGTNIQKWIATNGPIPPRLSTEIAIQALTGLDHLHSMGLIHRDISPENIMLSQDHHGKLLVKVIDFGIAKSLDEGESGHGLTQTGMFLGKLKYASPEQAGFLKDNEHLDPRSDLYSFGIVMYEMLAGRAPFQATNPHGYILKHVTEKPAAIHDLNPAVTVPPQLEAIIMRSLEKNREQRFTTAADFAQALEAIRNTIPPDQKYGLGERMVTLSGAQTLADLPKFTTGQAATMGGAAPTQQTQVGGTRPSQRAGAGNAGNEATVMERGLTQSTGSSEATVVERLGTQSAPTVMESKGQWAPTGSAAAEATVLERQMAPPAKKSNVGMMVAIAVTVVVLAGGGWFLLNRKQPSAASVQPTPSASSTASVTATAALGTAPIPAGQGALLLSASPWGELAGIVNEKNQKPVDLSDDKLSTPTRVDLEPGMYRVTLNGPNGPKTFDVQIDEGKRKPHHENFGGVDIGEIEKEMSNQ